MVAAVSERDHGRDLGAVIVEAVPRLRLERVWPEPPPIYASLAGGGPFVLAELPTPKDDTTSWFDTRYHVFLDLALEQAR